MLRSLSRSFALMTGVMLLAAAPLSLRAQEHATTTEHAVPEVQGPVDIITPHITDSHHLEIPWPNAHLAKEVELPTNWIVHIGGYELNMSPTKHVMFMGFAAVLAALVLIVSANVSRKQHETSGHTKGFAGAMEAMALYLRNEVVLPNVGHHGEAFVPFTLTLFFFILTMNLFGMLPWGATATGNVSVTAMLAIVTAIVVEVAGMRANGVGYLSTIFYWNKDLPLPMRIVMFFVMSPVEMVGKISKPFALTIRLFANMTAGHIVLLAIIGLIFSFKSWAITPVPVLMAVAISMLELFVAFLQAFIFTLLASVFIGQIREAHH